jgi:hypothetical protein
VSERDPVLNEFEPLDPRSETARRRILQNVHAIAVMAWNGIERTWVLEDGTEKTTRNKDPHLCLRCQETAAKMLGVDTPADAATGKAKFIPPWQENWPEAKAS